MRSVSYLCCIKERLTAGGGNFCPYLSLKTIHCLGLLRPGRKAMIESQAKSLFKVFGKYDHGQSKKINNAKI